MNMKKGLTISLAALLAAAAAGCSSSTNAGGDTAKPSSGSKEKVQLTLWYWNRSIDDNLLAQVNKQFPNIELKAEKIGGDFRAKLITTITAGTGAPDITGMNSDIATYFPSKDKFVNLFDLGAQKEAGNYLEWKWKQGVTGDGKFMLGYPMDTGPTALFYRADLFEKAGLPSDPAQVTAQLKDWNAYIDAARKMKAATNGQVFMFDNISTIYMQSLAQGDKVYFDTTDKFIGDQPHIKAAWDRAVSISKEGLSAKIGGGTNDWNAAMNNGKIASFIGAAWMMQILAEAAPDTKGKWRIARAPGGDGNNGGSFLAIPKQSKHPNEAFEVIKWLQSPENQLQAFTTMSLYPSAPSVLKDAKMNQPAEFFGGEKVNETFAESANHVKPAYFGAYANIPSKAFGDELTNVEQQNKDPEKAYADALANAKKQLEQATH
ncbi:sugar ABC transporter substrate-binding protein [Gordoniibacillus kamchatkensis]|uniref:Sugar ABC transporter substrate-binding protein n=1 Tax=Gordoniibacillus kamchatkensis TaxID=1590651 RepID=A0ABR5AJ47_9BACL|nr:extracellular solute-binding protein [Paenibacillus sp. VKM B-2647]KIL40773.1 sugar ABC transporter substrate-binding protein [Paenibacillus sp. VKM B-2647]